MKSSLIAPASKLPQLNTPESARLLADVLSGRRKPVAATEVNQTPQVSSGTRRAIIVTLAALAGGCGMLDKDEEAPVQEETEEEPAPAPAPEPIPPPTPVYCEPEITCAGPPISHEAGFSQIEVGVKLQNPGCWEPEAAKNVWLGAAPANRRVVTEQGVDIQPNTPDDLLDPDTATVMPITPTQAENRDRIRRILTVPQGDGNSFLVALQANNIEVDAAGRNHAARVAVGEVPAHPAIPLNTCFRCLTEDTNACGEMADWERDYCVWRYDPSIENVVGQVSRPNAPSTDVPPCEPQAAIRNIVRDILASHTAREESQREFRRFIERKAA